MLMNRPEDRDEGYAVRFRIIGSPVRGFVRVTFSRAWMRQPSDKELHRAIHPLLMLDRLAVFVLGWHIDRKLTPLWGSA